MTQSGRASLASSGRISGSGLASARISGRSAIFFTIAGLSTPPADRPRNTSAPAITSSSVRALVSDGEALLVRVHLLLAALVHHALDVGDGDVARAAGPSSPAARGRRAPPRPRRRPPALPPRFFCPTTFRPFRTAAPTMIAVPCWSSWNTGIFIRARSLRSTMKHSGALMSSRLMPPKVGSSAAMMSTSLSGSRSSISMSKQSMPANFLNSTALPSITGLAASGPMAPRPSTAVPLVITAIRLAREVRLTASAGSRTISSQAIGDAGRIGEREVALVGELLGGEDRDLAGARQAVVLEGAFPQFLVHIPLLKSGKNYIRIILVRPALALEDRLPPACRAAAPPKSSLSW